MSEKLAAAFVVITTMLFFILLATALKLRKRAAQAEQEVQLAKTHIRNLLYVNEAIQKTASQVLERANRAEGANNA